MNYFISKKIKTKKIIYGFFSKNGGYSSNNYFSLNCSLNSGDKKKIVKKNINTATNAIGFETKKIKFINQKHSAKIVIYNKKNINKTYDADASITKNKNIVLAVLTADCAPIFIFDKDNSLICAIHSGWKGCLKNIIKKTLDKINILEISNKKLIAIVGPCLDKKNFEVDISFRKKFIKKDVDYSRFFYSGSKETKLHFDMRGLINFQLKKCLVKNIENIDIDTYSKKNLFFSHRKSTHLGKTPTGRMINLIGFKDL